MVRAIDCWVNVTMGEHTRGQDKIVFASDHPVLSFERCFSEAHFSPRKPRA